MPAIISRDNTLVGLFPGDQIGAITNAIYRVVEKSFVDDKMLHPTRAEVKHRFGLCVKWARELRAERHWTVQRIEARLPDMLRAELNGTSWTPNERRVWLPQDDN